MFYMTYINKPTTNTPPTPATLACNELKTKFDKLCEDPNKADKCQIKKIEQVDDILGMIPPHSSYYVSAIKDLQTLKADKELTFEKVTRLIASQDCGYMRFSRIWNALDVNADHFSAKAKNKVTDLFQQTVTELKEKPSFLFALTMTTAAINLGEKKVLPLNKEDIEKLKSYKKELHEKKKAVNANFIATTEAVSKKITSKRKSKEDMNPLSPKEEAIEARNLLEVMEAEYKVALPYIERLSVIIEASNSRK
jgi:hypothetical protein